MPTICVASTTPSVSVVTASLVVTIVSGISFGPTDSGPTILVSGVVQPMGNVPISSNSILVGLLYE